ncbi:EGF-like repeat and discoidin I-like domain-containing protein 3 isoform X2 [Scleropages formosus]|uniref:EGF like repeats and discoidin domains 3 n=1 Tax=Scleropages formosus TaxID=113540 RepID=A0A8C9TGI7_SCLFO|nr:EGF-like repeat and discoidin I-like domain-containing protein 3 isoform X2 [Scleropages formosus]
MGPLFVLLVLCASAPVPQHARAADGEDPTSADPCQLKPCHNGGECEISERHRGDTFTGYVCNCPPGFNGIHCQHKCSGPLGMEGGIISNQHITASSTHRALFGLQKWYPYFARLNKKGLVNAWSAAENDRWPWIQINLERRMRVTGLITQGAKRIGSPEYVKSYKVAFSNNGKSWVMHKARDTDEDMIFRGNTDNNTPSANYFSPPIEAQYVRIYPQVCRRHCTLRMELLGCELTGCSEPMGMKTGHIQDYQITSSSVFQTLNMDMFSWEPGKARLDKQGKVNAWTSGHNDQSQWLQIDLLLPTKVTGIITQGAKDFGHVQFVGSYKLAFSNDGETWTVYQDVKQKKDKIFQGNFDNETHRKNVIEPPIYARFLRILPWSWYGRITLRLELLGCTEDD